MARLMENLFTYTCEICDGEVDLNAVNHDWDYTENGSGKVEWFICPHCGAGDINTNITYED
jgi:hypothetical protein